MNLTDATSVSQALVAEFSDVHDVGQLVRIVLRMGLALCCLHNLCHIHWRLPAPRWRKQITRGPLIGMPPFQILLYTPEPGRSSVTLQYPPCFTVPNK